MAFDSGLAQRVREMLSARPMVTERKMFGGLAFMLRGHMVVGVAGSSLMARVGPVLYEEALKARYVKKNVFGDRPTKGYVLVASEGLAGDRELKFWIDVCCAFVNTLPDKLD